MNINNQSQLAIIPAIYHPAALPEHAGNPLIEALPPFRQAALMVKEFRKYPHYAKEERLLPIPIRMMAVSRLNNYLEPLPCHLNVLEQIMLMPIIGYTFRNPLNSDYQKSIVKSYRESMNGKICPIMPSAPTTAPSFAIIGGSGAGKSLCAEQALTFLPQVVIHEKHQFAQVVWLKLDCPIDGSLKQLLNAILVKFDKLLGTSYRTTVRASTVDELIIDVANICAMHHLGMLVIDEIQNLLDASGIGQAKMLNFFVNYANEVKIPIITIGTPRALTMLEGTFREARRVGDHGTCMWDYLNFDDEWSFFLKSLWKYQWTSNTVPLTEEISKTFYDQTQGIHALVVRLFQLSQLQAIRDDSALTNALIIETAHNKFKLVAPMLNAIRTNDSKALTLYQDIFIKELGNLKKDVDLQGNIAVLKAHAQNTNQSNAEKLRTVSALIAIGFDQALAQQVVSEFFDLHPNLTANEAVKAILETSGDIPEQKESEKSPSLKDIVEAATESGRSPEEALSLAGIIGSYK